MGLAEVITLLMDFYAVISRIWGNCFTANYQNNKINTQNWSPDVTVLTLQHGRKYTNHRQKRKSYIQPTGRRKCGA